MTPEAEWAVFIFLSLTSIVMAALVIITMSMYRAGLALMASLLALAGLFILLDADLMAAMQVMMNVGGMMVMILFMVMIMMDPGGEMMWQMKRDMHLRGLGALSMSIPRKQAKQEHARIEDSTPESIQHANAPVYTCPMHPEVKRDQAGECPNCGMPLMRIANAGGSHQQVPTGSPVRKAKESPQYTCPMHPDVKNDEPGECPRCGMQLEPAVLGDDSQSRNSENIEQPDLEPRVAQYTCPMHPEVRQEQQGECPKCGMQLVEVGQGKAGSQENDGAVQEKPRHQMAGMDHEQHQRMMLDMAMSTSQLPWALALGAAIAILLNILVIRTDWKLSSRGPSADASEMVGKLLLSRYMIGFEGAALLILAGMAGAVIFAVKLPSGKERQ